MRHVTQQDEHGCFIASAAMVLDMSYEQMSQIMPLQDPEELRQTGKNTTGLVDLDRFVALLESRKISFDYLPSPFVCKPGYRYVMMLRGNDPAMNHAVAVDETGMVFDPLDEHARKDWSECERLGVIEVSFPLAD